jgi:hypothetical protein
MGLSLYSLGKDTGMMFLAPQPQTSQVLSSSGHPQNLPSMEVLWVVRL